MRSRSADNFWLFLPSLVSWGVEGNSYTQKFVLLLYLVKKHENSRNMIEVNVSK